MRTLVFSKDRAEDVERMLEEHGFEIVSSEPDIVVSVGGDGTLLLSEHEWPGVPKLAIGKSKTCKKCVHESPEETIKRLAARKENLPIAEYRKIAATLDQQDLPLALNDVVLRNKDQMHAIRFRAMHDDRVLAESIGDGIVISTAFGSTAYYKSITRETFKEGFGMAFNNTMEPAEPVVKKTGQFIIELTRGTGAVSIDTLEETWEMEPGQILTVRLSEEKARIIEF